MKLNLEKNLPIYVLFTVIAIKLFTLLYIKTYYWHDEIILTQTSKQPLAELFRTLITEAHPPGFFLVLKLLPVERLVLTNLILSSISLLIVISAYIFARREGVIDKYKLKYPTSLLFASYFFYTLTSEIKEDILTFPLLLFFTSVFLILTEKQKFKYFIIAVFISTLLLFLGYLSFLPTFFILILFAVYKHKKQYYLPIILQGIFFTFYEIFLGLQQQFGDASRIAWLDQYNNSIINTLSVSLVGLHSSYNIISDFILILCAFLVFYYSPKIKNKIGNKNYLVVLVAIGLMTPVYYYLKFFVRFRYITPLIILIFTMIGWGIEEIRFRKIKIFIIFIILTISSLSYLSSKLFIATKYATINQIVDTNTREHKLGFITDQEIFPLVFKLQYQSENENLIPINIFYPGELEDKKTISSSLLTINYPKKTFDKKFVTDKLLDYNFSSYVYLYEITPYQMKNDQENLLLESLSSLCSDMNIISISQQTKLILYGGCN